MKKEKQTVVRFPFFYENEKRMKLLKIQSKNLLNMKAVVNYLNFVFLTEVKSKSKYRILNFVFQFIKNTKWHFGYTDSILFILTLASDRAIFNGNDVFSILVLSTKNRYSSFLKKVFVFQKICYKVKVLKTFKISTDCHVKTCRSLKWRAVLKILSNVF